MKKHFKSFLKIVLMLFGFSIFTVIFYRFIPIYYTPLMIIRSFDKDYSINHQWVPLTEISKYMPRSVVRAEDANFYDHFGFDFEAIKKAQEYNKTHKKKKGASTISQQTAKNVFLWPARSYIRKGLEAYFTILIEIFWSKDRIMEAYLNVIELGPGVYGVEAASKKFFKKPAKKLNLSEAALLAAVLPNPIKFKVDRPSAYISRRQKRIMGRMNSTIEKPIKVDDNSDFLDIKFDEDDSKDENVTTPSSASSVESETEAQ
jgi:monofunctional biosynthetic peptidoglycan transglycosylase